MPYEKQNLTLITNETAVLELQFWDEEDVPYPVTEWEILAQVWSLDGLEKLADWQVTILDAVSATVELRLEPDQTRQLPERCVWDVLTVESDGTQRYWVGGDVRVERGYSRRSQE